MGKLLTYTICQPAKNDYNYRCITTQICDFVKLNLKQCINLLKTSLKYFKIKMHSNQSVMISDIAIEHRSMTYFSCQAGHPAFVYILLPCYTITLTQGTYHKYVRYLQHSQIIYRLILIPIQHKIQFSLYGLLYRIPSNQYLSSNILYKMQTKCLNSLSKLESKT